MIETLMMITIIDMHYSHDSNHHPHARCRKASILSRSLCTFFRDARHECRKRRAGHRGHQSGQDRWLPQGAVGRVSLLTALSEKYQSMYTYRCIRINIYIYMYIYTYIIYGKKNKEVKHPFFTWWSGWQIKACGWDLMVLFHAVLVKLSRKKNRNDDFILPCPIALTIELTENGLMDLINGNFRVLKWRYCTI